MEDITIIKDETGNRVVLVVDSSSIPVLRIESDDISDDFGPSDMIDTTSIGGKIFPAANIVYAWTLLPGRTPEELEAVKAFLSQWPEGPQVKA